MRKIKDGIKSHNSNRLTDPNERIRITSIKSYPNNKNRLIFDEQQSKTSFLNLVTRINNNLRDQNRKYHIELPKPAPVLVRVDSINPRHTPEEILTEMAFVNPDLEHENNRIHKRIKALKGADSVVIAFDHSKIDSIIRKPYMIIDNRKVMFRPFIEVKRCFACQDYGHSASHCKMKRSCAGCSGDNHSIQNCRNNNIDCVNCIKRIHKLHPEGSPVPEYTSHRALDHDCPYRHKWLELAMANINKFYF